MYFSLFQVKAFEKKKKKKKRTEISVINESVTF